MFWVEFCHNVVSLSSPRVCDRLKTSTSPQRRTFSQRSLASQDVASMTTELPSNQQTWETPERLCLSLDRCIYIVIVSQMQSTWTACKGVNQMVHTFRITKEQYSSGTTCRLQDLQREVLTVSIVSSHLSLGIKFCRADRTLGEAMDNFGRS